MECQGGLRARRAYIYMRFALACVFSLQVYRGGVLARYIFKWFFALRGLVLALDVCLLPGSLVGCIAGLLAGLWPGLLAGLWPGWLVA